MFNINNYSQAITQQISNKQQGFANKSDKYLEKLASGEGSLSMARHGLFNDANSLGILRGSTNSFANEQIKADLEANKNGLKLIQDG